MKKNSNLQDNAATQWADQVLTSLDGVSRATSNPFLYTRIMARLQEANSPWEKVASLISRPVFALAGLALFLALNLFVVVRDYKKEATEMASQPISLDQMLASEFSNAQSYSLVEINEEK